MKYLKLYETYKDIHSICRKYGITNYTINSDGSIDVDDNVNLRLKNLDKLPLKFNKVFGFFDCRGNNIKSFEGFPKHIGGNLYFLGNPIYEIWILFEDLSKIEFFNDCDIIQDGIVILDRLNFFLEEIEKPTVKKVEGYKCI